MSESQRLSRDAPSVATTAQSRDRPSQGWEIYFPPCGGPLIFRGEINILGCTASCHLYGDEQLFVAGELRKRARITTSIVSILMYLPQSRPEPISVDQFLPILMASEVKLELIDGFVVPFANGTQAHHLVCERIVQHLTAVAAKSGGHVFTSQIALRRSDAPTYVFPDASYTREAVEPNPEFIVAPRLVVEVMSPRSVERDRVDKLDTYREVPSIMEYLIVDSRRIWACVFRRSGRHWTVTNYGHGDTIELMSLDDAQLKLADLYKDTAAS